MALTFPASSAKTAWAGRHPSSQTLNNADQDERAERVRHVLDTMPDEQRQAIELAFFSDLSHHEISARLEQPLGVVKTRLRLGIFKLRDSLQKNPLML